MELANVYKGRKQREDSDFSENDLADTDDDFDEELIDEMELEKME